LVALSHGLFDAGNKKKMTVFLVSELEIVNIGGRVGTFDCLRKLNFMTVHQVCG
jgi:hypothetical protein